MFQLSKFLDSAVVPSMYHRTPMKLSEQENRSKEPDIATSQKYLLKNPGECRIMDARSSIAINSIVLSYLVSSVSIAIHWTSLIYNSILHIYIYIYSTYG